ncbi:MAG: hypothetical protein G01um101425_168 [Candidatus Peregrinibacteria bacterium Gr01-1014_25]|nr:MAG: hypothetical protein G01um101425_168 [Candidatus Peregrinibacteria bacterium Gr01-1014_25]
MSDSARSSAGILGMWGSLLLLLGFCGLQYVSTVVPEGQRAERLTSCTADGTPFASLEFSQWASTFHGTVDSVVAAHLKRRKSLQIPVRCAASGVRHTELPTDELEKLARALPPWKGRSNVSLFSGPSQAPDLSEDDIGPVLLEFLRTYECSMTEYQLEKQLQQSGESTAVFVLRANSERRTMREELQVARAAVGQTLVMLGGIGRLNPLLREFLCLERASIDLRNGLGLVAEASACLPRAWDARGTVRDLPSASQQ